MKEWTRTFILIGIILAALAYILWMHHTASTSLTLGI
jgi:hypothetical protein